MNLSGLKESGSFQYFATKTKQKGEKKTIKKSFGWGRGGGKTFITHDYNAIQVHG
jgi:hypothetical protein